MRDLEAFVAAVRAQAADASRLMRRLRLPAGVSGLNVHAYGLAAYEAFLRRHHADGRPRVLVLSMNPGPNGAVQTGIPFCDLPMARALVPGFDALVPRRPAWAASERAEMSARKLLAWAVRDLGGEEAIHGRILFAMTLPLAFLRRGRNVTNVPVPALPASCRGPIDAFLGRNAAGEILAAGPTGVLLMGDYAAHVWEIARRHPDLAAIRALRVPHPAARIGNAAKLDAWSAALRALEAAPAGIRRRTAGSSAR